MAVTGSRSLLRPSLEKVVPSHVLSWAAFVCKMMHKETVNGA